jgi:hypothetical protein
MAALSIRIDTKHVGDFIQVSQERTDLSWTLCLYVLARGEAVGFLVQTASYSTDGHFVMQSGTSDSQKILERQRREPLRHTLETKAAGTVIIICSPICCAPS